MAEAYKVESGIPIPPRCNRRSTPETDAFKSMNVGDSLFVPMDHEAGNRQFNNISGRVTYFHGPRSASVRKVEGGYRVWRVA